MVIFVCRKERLYEKYRSKASNFREFKSGVTLTVAPLNIFNTLFH